jgi:UDP:flavonoid glycosyltransferase YjiC (YdhE family)
MKILLISIGTRGDVEPFLAVGKLLQESGHEVHTAFPAQYAYLANETGLTCNPLDPAFIELI